MFNKAFIPIAPEGGTKIAAEHHTEMSR